VSSGSSGYQFQLSKICGSDKDLEKSLAIMLSLAYIAGSGPTILLLLLLKVRSLCFLIHSMVTNCQTTCTSICSLFSGRAQPKGGFVGWAMKHRPLIYFVQDVTVMLKSLISGIAIFYFLQPTHLIACSGVSYRLNYRYEGFVEVCALGGAYGPRCTTSGPDGTSVFVSVAECENQPPVNDQTCQVFKRFGPQQSFKSVLIAGNTVRNLCDPKVKACSLKETYATAIAINQFIFCFCICLKATHKTHWVRAFPGLQKKALLRKGGLFFSILAFLLGM
jgi:hypothetical protein